MNPQAGADDCPNSTLWVALAAFLSHTLEVWLRAFALGFGAHMLSFLFLEKRDADFEDIKGFGHQVDSEPGGAAKFKFFIVKKYNL